MRNTTRAVDSDLIFQSVGLSTGWVTASPNDAPEGALHQMYRWAEFQFASIPNPTFQRPAVLPAETILAIEKARNQASSLFASEGIYARFKNPTTKKIQEVLGLKSSGRVSNTLPLDIMQPNTKSLHLLELLRLMNSKEGRSLTINDLLRLAIHTGGSITDFCPDSHILIANLASFLIRFHLQSDLAMQNDKVVGNKILTKSPRLRDTWDAVGSKYPRVSPKGLEELTENQLRRRLLMFLYGVLVLKYGQIVPAYPMRFQDIQDRVRELFNQRFVFWPRRLSDLMNEIWESSLDQDETVDYYSEEVALIAQRVGRCLLGQYPLVSDFVG